MLDDEGELASFRRIQEQPSQRGRALHAQLHRSLGTRAERKARDGTLLVDALQLSAKHTVATPANWRRATT